MAEAIQDGDGETCFEDGDAETVFVDGDGDIADCGFVPPEPPAEGGSANQILLGQICT